MRQGHWCLDPLQRTLQWCCLGLQKEKGLMYWLQPDLLLDYPFFPTEHSMKDLLTTRIIKSRACHGFVFFRPLIEYFTSENLWEHTQITLTCQTRQNEEFREQVQFMDQVITWETDDSAASARMSAQETTPGQELSTAVLMLSTTPKPRIELTLGAASFSLSMLELLSSRIEASHPCPQNQIYSST